MNYDVILSRHEDTKHTYKTNPNRTPIARQRFALIDPTKMRFGRSRWIGRAHETQRNLKMKNDDVIGLKNNFRGFT